MMSYVNPHLIKRILVLKTRKYKEWVHIVKDTKFLFWKKHYDYWYYLDSCFGTYSEQEMLKEIDVENSFYKDGIVYRKPHVILEFSKTHFEVIYFDNNNEMNDWVKSFTQKYKNSFILVSNGSSSSEE